MDTYEPRGRLPEEWARRAACPVCQSIGLEINHAEGSPDRMVCSGCRVSFEIALDFTHLRLVRLPDRQIVNRIDLIGCWVTPVELRAIVDQPLTAKQLTEPVKKPVEKPSITESKSILATLPKMTQDEVNKRAVHLAALGNSTETVRVALERAGATAEQIARGQAEIVRVRQQKFNSQKTGLWVIAILAILALLAFGAWLFIGGAIQ